MPDHRDQTLLTKWGRLTSQQWLRQRYLEELNRWLTPEALHYIHTRTPYYDENGQEIVDHHFLWLLQNDPEHAMEQQEREEIAYRHDLALRLRRIDEQQAAGKAQPATRARPQRTQSTHHQPSLI